MSAVKTKFIGLLRGLLRRFEDGNTVAPGEVEPTSPVNAAPPVLPAAPPTVESQPIVEPETIEPVAPPRAPANPDEVQLPLTPILAGLPLELRGKIVIPNTAGMVILLPVDKILPQLATGMVRISFGELRQLAAGVFAAGNEHDAKPVALPLHQVITQINPILLARRAAQRQVEVSDEISSPFDARGHGLKISTEKMKAPAPVPASVPEPVPLSRFNAPAPVAPVSRAPVGAPPPTFTPRWNTPAANGGSNGNGHSNGHGNGSTRPAGFDVPLEPVPPRAKAPVPTSVPKPAAAQVENPILVSLDSLSESWPEALKQEIDLLDLRNAQVALPPNLIEPALKRGRVVFAWRDLRSWIQNVAVAVSAHDAVELELPLKVLAPLFFARQRNNGAGSKKIAVSEEIPDLFFGFPQPAAEPPLPTPPTAPIPMPAAAAAPVAAPTPDTNYFNRSNQPETSDSEFKRKGGGTDFSHRAATPADIVSRAMKLPGVVGTVIALPDGLKVASQIPAELNGDTLAAFLPQIFARVNQCSRELRMGELNNLNFTVGNVPWKIFRVNAVYFAAFGRANEPLPGAPLAVLAAELDRKKA